MGTIRYADTINGAGVALSVLTGNVGIDLVYVQNGDGSGNPFYWTCQTSVAAVDHTTVEAVLGISGARWLKSFPASVSATPPANSVTTAMLQAGAVTAAKVAAGLLPDPGTLADSGASALTDWTFATGLTGDTDGNYSLEGTITIAAAGAALTLNFNSNSTPSNVSANNIRANGATVTGVGSATSILVGADPIGGGGTLSFKMHIESKAGLVRFITGEAFYLDGGGTKVSYHNFAQIAAANATQITDLRIHSDTAVAIGAHSFIVWRKLNQTAQ